MSCNSVMGTFRPEVFPLWSLLLAVENGRFSPLLKVQFTWLCGAGLPSFVPREHCYFFSKKDSKIQTLFVFVFLFYFGVDIFPHLHTWKLLIQQQTLSPLQSLFRGFQKIEAAIQTPSESRSRPISSAKFTWRPFPKSKFTCCSS